MEEIMSNTTIARGFLSRFKTFILIASVLGFGLTLENGVTQKTSKPELSGDIRAHDPSMIKAGAFYYVFATGDENGLGEGSVQIRRSSNMQNWEYVGTMFNALPTWIAKEIGKVPNLWAPDVSYVNGKYLVYYAASHFGKNDSVIGLASNVTLDPNDPKYKWLDEGLVVKSRASDNWNAIDANRVVDAKGQPWLAFGSYWEGIKLRRLDAKTNKFSSQDTKLYPLASRSGGAVEAASLIYQKGYYYLFVSYDTCCQGANSNYKIKMGRSKNITGPYVRRDNWPLMASDADLVLEGHDNIRGPGGQTVFNDNGTIRMVYHYYDADAFGAVKFQVETLTFGKDDWLGLK
jgi:arabinan endo-1,5-alpha-L-arabinosidase